VSQAKAEALAVGTGAVQQKPLDGSAFGLFPHRGHFRKEKTGPTADQNPNLL